MPRRKRAFISRDIGLFHIISRVAGGDLLFKDAEKEYFLASLERFAAGFYVHIHAFCVMSNHFHLLVSERTQEASMATKEELLARHSLLYGPTAEPPSGKQELDGSITIDDDGGLERLRARLGSVSRFVQELKQTYSRWFNKRHRRKGYLWGGRFSSLAVERGGSELACSAYIELNPLRAGMVKIPEDYRWCSLGLTLRNPSRAKSLLSPLLLNDGLPAMSLAWYRLFVYKAGGIEVADKAAIAPEIVREVEAVHGCLGLGQMASYRLRNLSEGVALGGREFVAAIQQEFKRKFIRPRSFSPTLFCTRVLASP